MRKKRKNAEGPGAVTGIHNGQNFDTTRPQEATRQKGKGEKGATTKERAVEDMKRAHQ